MKTICLILLLALSATSNSQDTIARVKYTNTLIYGQKIKVLKHLTSNDENNVHVAYAKLGKQEKLWLVNEQRLASDGFDQSSYTSYIFLDHELLAIVVKPLSKECKRCRTIYYFFDDHLIYTREEYSKKESVSQDIGELLDASKRYRTKASLFYKN